MPISPTYPGVYIEELPSAVRTIIGVPTSIAAFVGTAPRGAVDRPVHITNWGDYESEFGGLDTSSDLSYAVYQFYQNGGSEAEIVRIVRTDPGETGTKATSSAITISGATGDLVLAAASPGKWGDSLLVRIEANPDDNGTPQTTYNLAVRDSSTRATESYLNVSTDPTAPRGLAKLLASSSLISVTSGDSNLPKPHKAIDPKDGSPDPFDPKKPDRYTQATATSGADGDKPGDADYIGSVLDKTGINQLMKADIFNILCLPGLAVDHAFIPTALKFCVDHRAMLIADPPEGWTSVQAAFDGVRAGTALTAEGGANSALYFPRITAADPKQNGFVREFAPSGVIAGIWARTDVQRGVWKAPAGTDATLNGVSKLTLKMNDLENGRLNPQGLNCLRTLPVFGNVAWGARTGFGSDQRADQWKYVPVRRLALFLEESLYRGTQWVVFEPNDEPLWSSVRLNVGAFMNNLFRQGAFQGSTPQQAYKVTCDATNNPQNTIDQGIVNIQVGFAPLKPAEFVIIQIQQLAGQIQV
ncbi:MAG: phage tail protein [Amycolatopsis sp.]|uniref:phage tail sheath family protein n=1 Tax=Amycolatopsis sp. TaxID=37632 RepID=UPI002627D24D|nr:phage tail sheath C-terminal domain-containing protein [Amycolatopsis sp.]MCU1682730.1 phage tail protein [Amycolatopsis sp.]